ncbi:MAG: thioredoxin family protein [Cyanobacteria bacterium]|nr:thioredoxin family protein [Cyanobacteriota bacterium]
MQTRIVTALAAVGAALLGGVLSASSSAPGATEDEQAPRTRPGVAELAVVPAALDVQPGGSARAAITVKLPDGLHMNSDKPREENLIPITVSMEAVPAVTGATAAFPDAVDLKQEGAALPLRVFEREFAIGLQVTAASDASAGAHKLPLRVRYQACDEKQCYLPVTASLELNLSVSANAAVVVPPAIAKLNFANAAAVPIVAPKPVAPAPAAPSTPVDAMAMLDRFTVRGTEGGYLPAATFTKFVKDAQAGVARQGMFEGRGPLAILLIVFLGGLALNLTPCVLPMIPVNLAIIGAGSQVKQAEGSRSRGLLLGSVYGAAMALVYGVLGLIVILSAQTFGTINASPWFNLGIAVLFVALALAMFDVFEIDFSKYSANVGTGSSRGSVMLAFTMGGVAALLAGACVAPVVIQVVLFSTNLYATGTTAALALPFVLGLGMAAPWPVAGAGISALPKPGAWMVRVKQGFGVIILLTAGYYAYTAYGIFRDRSVDPAQVSSSVDELLKEGWYADLAEGLAVAERDGKPVLIDMWATWCKNCLIMDKTTLVDPSVKAALDGFVKIKFQAESPDESPAREVMQRFGAVGLPTYVVLTPK